MRYNVLSYGGEVYSLGYLDLSYSLKHYLLSDPAQVQFFIEEFKLVLAYFIVSIYQLYEHMSPS